MYIANVIHLNKERYVKYYLITKNNKLDLLISG